MTSLSAINTLSSSAITRHTTPKFGNIPVTTVAKEAAKDTMNISTKYWPTLGAFFVSDIISGFAGGTIGALTAGAIFGFDSESVKVAGYAIGNLVAFLGKPLTFKKAAEWFLKVPK